MARKICVLTSAHQPFDVRIFHKQCKSIARAGYEVTLIASIDNDGVHEGIKFLRLPRWKNRFERFLRSSYAIYKKGRQENADIYHFHDPELIPAALLLRLAGKKVVYDIHEDLPRTISYKSYIPNFLKGSISRAAEFVEDWAGARFSGLVAATPTIGVRFRRVNNNVAIVNNYPRIEEIEPPSDAATEKREAATLLYVGMRITRARGAEEMVRAVGLLPDKLQARLRLVGSWGSEELPRSLSSIPGWARTEYVGPVDRTGIAWELRKASVGLVILHPEPNYVASQPVKLFEYMCAGIPVIVSDFPICREIVTKARCGILVNPLDPGDIARAAEYLLTHPEEAEEMGRRGFQAVHEHYNWANEEKTLVQMYERLFNHDPAYQGSLAGHEVRSLKILVLAQYFAPEIGASQVRLGSFCREVAQAGHSVEIVTAMPHHPAGRIFPEYQGNFYRSENWEGLTVHRVWLYAANSSNLKRLLNYASFCLTCLFGLARASRPDYIFVDSPPLFLGVPGWIGAKIWRVPLLFNVADLWPDSVRDLGIMSDGLLVKMAYGLERWIYRHATSVTAVTEGIRTVLLGSKRLPPGKVMFLPNGVDTKLFKPSPPDENLKRSLGLVGKKIVLYAGNHGYAGAVEQVLFAANCLRDEPSLHFLLIGDGPEKRKLVELATSLNLANVTFHDQVPLASMPSFLSISDLAVVTLRKSKVMAGARPAKSFVMMAGGKPIVLSAEGEAAHLIETAGSGVVVPPEDYEAIAKAIRKLTNDPGTASQLGANGRRFVVSNFQWSSLVRNWLAQLSNISTSPARPKGDLHHAEREAGTPLSND